MAEAGANGDEGFVSFKVGADAGFDLDGEEGDAGADLDPKSLPFCSNLKKFESELPPESPIPSIKYKIKGSMKFKSI